jgi:hypothetical protein
MKKGILKLKVIGTQLAELCKVYDQLLTEYRPENPHEQLLLECAAAFRHRVRQFVEKEQEKYTLPISGIEAIAFMQLWASQPIHVPPYGSVVISSIIGKIDSKHTDIKHIYG